MDDYEKRYKEVAEILDERLEPHRKAVKIVERLTEKSVDEDFFKSCATFLMPSHYTDAVEERSLEKLCGYPLCDHPLEETKQKYRISMKTNKVYDMSERKFFCSQSCFKASKYYQAQMASSPLWSRPRDKQVEIKLLKEGERLPSSDEPLDSMIIRLRVTEDEIEKPKKEAVTTGDVDDLIQDLSYLRLHDSKGQRKRYEEFENKELEQERLQKMREKAKGTLRKDCADLDTSGLGDKEDNTPLHDNGKLPNTAAETKVNFGGRGTSDKGTSDNSEVQNEGQVESHRKGINPGIKIIQQVSQCLTEWRTSKTLIYLNENKERSNSSQATSADVKMVHGSSRRKEEGKRGKDLRNKEKRVDEVMDGLLSIKEEREDERNVQGVVTYAASNPVPNIDQLRGETGLFTLKVNQFYSLKPDKLQPSAEAKEKKTKSSDKEKSNEPGRNITLPPVDSQSQMVIRQKIFLSKLHNVLRDLLPTLGMSVQDISANLRDLVVTFNLSSRNISFKPAGWTLVSLCLLHILALREAAIHSKLTNPRSQQFLQVVWKQYSISGDEVGRLVSQFIHGDDSSTS